MQKSISGRVIGRIISRLTKSLRIFDLIPPYEHVQSVTEQSVHSYLGREPILIERWVIVGGYLGKEVPRILRNYPKCKVTIFECSQRYCEKLRKRFSGNPRVEIIEKAVSDQRGEIEFFETNIRGSGSLLRVGELSEKSYGMQQQESFLVDATTLDEEFGDTKIDVLQLDVQGAELKVLRGAGTVLRKVGAVLTEVSVRPHLYEGSAILGEIESELNGHGFEMVLLGTDFNLTGNALYLKTSL